MIFTNIENLCKEKNISIAKLEKEIGLGNATIRKWKTVSPNVEKLKLVADFFGVTVDSLISPQGTNTSA